MWESVEITDHVQTDCSDKPIADYYSFAPPETLWLASERTHRVQTVQMLAMFNNVNLKQRHLLANPHLYIPNPPVAHPKNRMDALFSWPDPTASLGQICLGRPSNTKNQKFDQWFTTMLYWLVVWLPSILFSQILLGISSSRLTFIFFRGVA